MKDVNKVILMGRLGVEPTLKNTNSGVVYSRFSVATSRYLKDQTQVTQWHKIVAWGKMAEHCARYLKKGQPVYLEGELRSHDYEDKEGVSRMSFEVHAQEVSFLGYPKNERAEINREEIVVESMVQ